MPTPCWHITGASKRTSLKVYCHHIRGQKVKASFIGSAEWLVALRSGAFANRPPVPWEPPKKRPAPAIYWEQTTLPLAEHHGKDCPYCGEMMLLGSRRRPTREHVIPRHLGGTLSSWNKLIVCDPCNNDKGGKTLLEFARWLCRQRDRRAHRVGAILRMRQPQSDIDRRD